MPNLLTNILLISNKSRMYFDHVTDKVYPYDHVILVMEIGTDVMITAKANSRGEAKKKLIDALPEIVKQFEFLSGFDLRKTSLPEEI